MKMDNGANETNQTMLGVRVAPPSEKPVDATTNDVGAANGTVSSNPVMIQPQVVAATTTATPVVTQVTNSSQSNTVDVSSNGQGINADKNDVVSNSDDSNGKKKKTKKPKNKLARFYFLIIILLVGGFVYFWNYHQQQITLMNYKCTPVSTTGDVKELDLDSTIVKDLYSKVSTTIKEDVASAELNDQMKIYLAYRQIATSSLYESNCNKYNSQGMEPFKCEVTASFVPKAFKENVLQVELKKLFGEDTNIANQNVQLGTSCVGGFQYIAERGEYVQGSCASQGAILYSADKKLVKATSTESVIELYEDVKYYGNEGYELSSKLVSGTYKYTFKLDMNYNYVYLNKMLVE